MIVKGNQRGGGRDHATHLMNEFDNELVEVFEIRGSIAKDLHGAYAEWFAHSKATRCTEFLYPLVISPDDGQGNLTREQYLDFIGRAEKKLELTGQGRTIVFHTKEGRLHAHVTWSRIDIDKMKAVQLSNDRLILRSVVKDFARDHGLKLPPGYEDRDLEHSDEKVKPTTWAEEKQEERTGISPKEHSALITEAWRGSDGAKSFIQALKDRGYELAAGDRGYVAVDRFGEIHSLARRIQGAKSKDVKARLQQDYPLSGLPNAETQQEKIRAELQRAREERAREQSRDREQIQPQPESASDAERQPQRETPKKSGLDDSQRKLEDMQARRRGVIEKERGALIDTHIAERQALDELQRAQIEQRENERLCKPTVRLAGFLSRVTGISLRGFKDLMNKVLPERLRGRSDSERLRKEHGEQKAALARKHQREREYINRRLRDLALVEKRERLSLETRRRRELYRDLVRDEPLRTERAALDKEAPASIEPRNSIDELRENASAAAPLPQTESDRDTSRETAALTVLFNRAANFLRRDGGKATGGPRPREEEKQAAPERADIDDRALREFLAQRDQQAREADRERSRPSDREEFNKAAAPPPPDANQESLRDILNRLAADKENDKDIDDDFEIEPGGGTPKKR